MISPIGKNKAADRSDRSGGFTLIELLLVMLIIAVLVGMAVPLLSRTYGSVGLEALALNMRKLMVYGRAKALSSGLRHRLAFDRDFSGFALEVETGSASGGRGFTEIEGKPGRSNTVPSGISVATPQTEIVIYPDGSIDPVKVVVTDRSGRTYVLETSGMTGRVYVYEDRHE